MLDVFPYLSNNAKGLNSSSKQIVRFSNCSFHCGCVRKKKENINEQLNHFISRTAMQHILGEKTARIKSVVKTQLTVPEPDCILLQNTQQ